MAVAFRADADVTNGTAGTSVVVAKPAGTVDGDHLVAFISATGIPSITPPADWVLVTSAVDATNAVTMWCYEKLAASEGANWTWTLGSSQRNLGWVGCYTGVDPDDPIVDSATDLTLTSDTTLSPIAPDVNPGGMGVSGSATVRTASGVATTWTHTVLVPTSTADERADLSTNAGAGTDIAGGVADTAHTGTAATVYFPTLVASQTQTAGVAIAVTLKAFFEPYDGAIGSAGLTVEAAFGADPDGSQSEWTWTDVTDYVMHDSRVNLTHGRTSSTSTADPATLAFTLKNFAGEWTSPTGAFTENFVRNLPFRVRLSGFGTGVYHRGTAFLASARPRWDETTNYAVVDVVAAGRLRRLQQGEALHSAAYRSMIGTLDAGSGGALPVGYWPLEDESDATVAASALPGGGLTAPFTTGMNWAADSNWPGSAPLAQFAEGAVFYLNVDPYPATSQWTALWVMRVPEPAAATVLMTVRSSGSARRWYVTIDPSSDDLTLTVFDAAGTLLDTLNLGPSSDIYDELVGFEITATQDGTAVDYEFLYYTAAAGFVVGFGSSDSIAGQTAGNLNYFAVPVSTGLIGATVGHLAAYAADVSASGLFEAPITGYVNEIAIERFWRLLIEEGVAFDLDSENTPFDADMGPQGVGTLVDLLREVEAVEGSVLHDSGETISSTGILAMPARSSRDNAATVLTLNVASGHVQTFEPSLDDREIRNDVEAARIGGGSARATDEASVAREGRYKDRVTLSLRTDDQLADIAGYRLALGTIPGMRFPAVSWNLRRSPTLAEQWLACVIGSRVDVTNPPSQFPPDTIETFLEGWTEVLTQDQWEVTAYLSPAAANHVFNLADTAPPDSDPFLGRLAGDPDAAIRTAIDDNDTSVGFDPLFHRWTTDSDHFDPDLPIRLGGEVITVSAISTTVANFVAAGAASHANNAAVTPALFANPTIRRLILVLAAIRSSGTGTLLTPDGYTRLPVFEATDNVQLFAKISNGSESDPTVTPSGGSAGDTVSAFTFGFSNMPGSVLADLGDIVIESLAQLNASAQNIAYPGVFAHLQDGCVSLIVGWKQDDYTSVAVPSGFTEILEASSTTGSDQSLYAAYRINTTPAVTNEGSLAVTGGASAISRGAAVAIAGGFQTLTISARSVNGVVKAHAAGTKIEVEDPGRLGR